MHFLVDLNQIHALHHGAGNVDPTQPRHGVQLYEVVVWLRIPDTLEPGLGPSELQAVVGSAQHTQHSMLNAKPLQGWIKFKFTYIIVVFISSQPENMICERTMWPGIDFIKRANLELGCQHKK